MDNLKNKVFSGFIWKFGERFLSQGITFVVSLVVARILLPEDYGMVAMVTIFTNIAAVVVVNGFNAALIQGSDVDETDFSTLFYCSFVISIILYFILFFFAPLISKFYDMQELTPIIRVLGFLLPIASYNSIQNAYVSRMMDFKKNFWATFLASIVSGTVGIVMALRGFGVWALVAQMLSSSIVNCIVQMFIVDWKPVLRFSLKKVVPLLRFGGNSLGADLIGTIFNQLNSFVIGKWYSPSDLAYYNKGYSFPQLINGNILAIVSSVMFPAFSTVSNDIEHMKMMTKKTAKMMTYILGPIYFGMIAISNNMIRVLLTDKWISSVPFLNIICIAYIVGTISPMDLQLLRAIGKSDTVFHLEFIKKTLWLALTIVALFVNVYAVAIVLPIATLIEIIVNGIAIKKYFNYGLGEKISDWIKVLIPSLLMFCIVFVMNYIPLPSFPLLLIQILAGAVFYILYSVVSKNECFVYLKSTIRGKK